MTETALAPTLSHYAIAVHDLDQAVSDYERLFGMRVGERGNNPWGHFRWAQMGWAGEQAIQLIQPESDDTHVTRVMRARASERNPHGEGYYISVWRTPDPVALAAHIESTGGRVIDRGDGSGVHWVHPSTAHGAFMEIVPAKAPGPEGTPLRISHLGVAVADLDEAEETFRRRFGWIRPSDRWVLESGDFEASSIFAGEVQAMTLMHPRTAESPIAAEMRRRADEKNPRGEGPHISVWTSPDTTALAERIEAGGGRVIRTSGWPDAGSMLIPPSVTHGMLMEVTPQRAEAGR